MHRFNFFRIALLTASLVTHLGGVGTASARTTETPQAAPQVQQPSYASPYDSPNFVLDESNIFG